MIIILIPPAPLFPLCNVMEYVHSLQGLGIGCAYLGWGGIILLTRIIIQKINTFLNAYIASKTMKKSRAIIITKVRMIPSRK